MRVFLLVFVVVSSFLIAGLALKRAALLSPSRSPDPVPTALVPTALAPPAAPIPAHYRLAQPRHWRACVLQQR
jgi:hypothetical protein